MHGLPQLRHVPIQVVCFQLHFPPSSVRSVLSISSLCFTGSFWFLSFGYNYILQFQMIPIMTFRERARDVKMGPS